MKNDDTKKTSISWNSDFTASQINRFSDSMVNISNATKDTSRALSKLESVIKDKMLVANSEEFRKFYLGSFVPEPVSTKGKKMSCYPIQVGKVSMNHQGGTKSYHITLARNADGKCLLVFRWGKTGAFGDVKTIQFDDHMKAEAAFSRKIDERVRKGYATSPTVKDDVICSDLSDLRDELGRALMSKLGRSNLSYIDSLGDFTGVRDAEDPRLDEDGKINQETLRQKEARLAREKADMAAKIREKEERQAKEAYQSNSDYGAF